MQYIWLIWSLMLVGIWLVVYILLRSKKTRKEMLVISLASSLSGLTQFLFVPAYWSPPSLFNLNVWTRLDIESLIFSFGIAGIVIILYKKILQSNDDTVVAPEPQPPFQKFHIFAIALLPAMLLVLLITTKLNPIYSSIIAMMGAGIATWFCRPDLKKKMMVSGGLFLVLYFFYFLMLIIIAPLGYVEQVWNLKAISGIMIVGIPIEELLFAFGYGFIWSSIYEYLVRKRIVKKPTPEKL